MGRHMQQHATQVAVGECRENDPYTQFGTPGGQDLYAGPASGTEISGTCIGKLFKC